MEFKICKCLTVLLGRWLSKFWTVVDNEIGLHKLNAFYGFLKPFIS